MTRLLAFLFFVSFANCCQRKNEVMSCHRLPETNERMVGVSILIVERVFGEKVDLRGFQLSKIMIKFSEVTCDGLLFGRDTQVFLGDKMCPIVSKHILSLIFFLFMYIFCLKWTLRRFLISNCLCLSGFGRVASQTGLLHHDDPYGNSGNNLQ